MGLSGEYENEWCLPWNFCCFSWDFLWIRHYVEEIQLQILWPLWYLFMITLGVTLYSLRNTGLSYIFLASWWVCHIGRNQRPSWGWDVLRLLLFCCLQCALLCQQRLLDWSLISSNLRYYSAILVFTNWFSNDNVNIFFIY